MEASLREGTAGTSSRSFSRIAPAVTASSRENSPSVPAQARCSLKHPESAIWRATATALSSDPQITSSAPRAASRARVPLVVVITIVFPATASGVYSRGELPRSNPLTFNPSRSPPSSDPSIASAWCRAVSTEATGKMRNAPFASAVTMVLVARRASITTTVEPTRDFDAGTVRLVQVSSILIGIGRPSVPEFPAAEAAGRAPPPMRNAG